MTDTERLEAIEARAKGLTDLCAEHLRQSIRHVQRNCDIQCSIHEGPDAWDACKQPDRYDGDRMAAVLADIPYLLDLVRHQQEVIKRYAEEDANVFMARVEARHAERKAAPEQELADDYERNDHQ